MRERLRDATALFLGTFFAATASCFFRRYLIVLNRLLQAENIGIYFGGKEFFANFAEISNTIN